MDWNYPGPFRRALLAPRYWGIWLALGLFRLFMLLPQRWRLALGARMGELSLERAAKRRAIVRTNLEWCFPELDDAAREARARACFRAAAQSFADYGLVWWGSRRQMDERMFITGAEALEATLAAGRPAILLTCHSVFLDYGALSLTRRFPVLGMIKHARNPAVDWFLADRRSRLKGIVARRDHGMRPVVRALREGYAFFYVPDEDLGPERSIFVPFFGIPTATVEALPRLVKMTGAAVFPFTTILHEDGRYETRLLPPLADYPGTDERADVARMNLELEKLIRLAPDQYMWSLRLFQTRPDGSPPPYAMKGKPGSGPRPRPADALPPREQ